MSQIVERLIERVNNITVEEFQQRVHKTPLNDELIKEYQKYSKEVNEYLKEHPEYYSY